MKYVLRKWYKQRDHRRFNYPKDVDEEMVQMLDVFNNIPGVRTRYCCCGHGDSQWYLSLNCVGKEVAAIISEFFRGRDDFEVEVESASDNCVNMVSENAVVVRSERLGRMPQKERFKEYRRICEFFSHAAPYRGWERVSEF